MVPGKYRLEEWDTLLLATFDYFRNELLSLQTKAISEENVKGVSDKFCRIQYLHLVNYWYLLAYLRIKDGTSYEDTKLLLKFDTVQASLSCNGISGKALDNIWSLERNGSLGVSGSSVDGTFQVGFGDTVFDEVLDIRALLALKEGCCPTEGSAVDVLATQTPDPLVTQFGAYILI